MERPSNIPWRNPKVGVLIAPRCSVGPESPEPRANSPLDLVQHDCSLPGAAVSLEEQQEDAGRNCPNPQDGEIDDVEEIEEVCPGEQPQGPEDDHLLEEVLPMEPPPVLETQFSMADPRSSGLHDRGPSGWENVINAEFDSDAGSVIFLPSEEVVKKELSNMSASHVRSGANLRGSWKSNVSDDVQEEIRTGRQQYWSVVIDSWWFEGFFLCLTLYAMFAPDMDLLYGNKESQLAISIASLFVCLFFMAEIVLQALGRQHYICKAYFWLDIISVVSMLPDTWLMTPILGDGQHATDSSSRFTEFLFVAIKSARGARLNRWRRLARVAGLMPRLQRVLGNPLLDQDTSRLLDKKLERIFQYLDEDSDGYITESMAAHCIAKIIAVVPGGGNHHTDTPTFFVRAVTKVQLATSRTHRAPKAAPGRFSRMSRTQRLFRMSNQGSSTTDFSDSHKRSAANNRISNGGACLDLEGFRNFIIRHGEAIDRLWHACRHQILQGNNMQSAASRKTDYMAVKVALSVLLLLFVLSFILVPPSDTSDQWGLTALDRLVRTHFANHTEGMPVPHTVAEQIRVWLRDRPLLYLDLNKRTYCSDISPTTLSCSALLAGADPVWGVTRTSLARVDEELSEITLRRLDMAILRVPDLSGTSVSAEALESQTTALCVMNERLSIESGAKIAMCTTAVVIVVILVGIGLLVRDLSWFSSHLLRPLVEVTDEMESISRMQLAAISAEQEEDRAAMVGEIKVIRDTFNAFKAGIISWGRYVPWPVVQLCMRTGAEVNLEVKDAEVTAFFSDIASFTTIVESLPPERSLLLLSRYFHDMSKVIDDYKGIVIDYIGDAIFAIYGDPVENVEHPTDAVKSAVRMLDCLRSLNQWCLKRELPTISIRCGVHTGRMLVGNMGVQSRMKYGVIGDECDIPSRLEEMNKNYSTKLLISKATYDRLIPGTFVTRPIDIVRFGEAHEEAQVVYEVLDRNHARQPDLPKMAEVHAEAFHLYRERAFHQAAMKFRDVNKFMADFAGEEDIPSSMMQSRCEAYLQRAPSPVWDGVWQQRQNELH